MTVTGTGFVGASAVDFGSVPATTYSVTSSSTITATSPAEGAATVDVTVSTPSGTSATSPADRFTYQAAPTISAISPVAGPLSGGSTVNITGTNFAGATGASFGSSTATTYSVTSSTSISATAPAEAAGTVDVTVSTPSGTAPPAPPTATPTKRHPR